MISRLLSSLPSSIASTTAASSAVANRIVTRQKGIRSFSSSSFSCYSCNSSSSSSPQLLSLDASSRRNKRFTSILVTSSMTAADPRTTTEISKRWHGGDATDNSADVIHVSFLQPDGTVKTVEGRVGDSFLQVAHRHDIDLEGACEGVCACSTCHLIFPQHVYDDLPEPSEEEEDMLDMAFGLTECSRLGCQVILTKDMEGIQVEMPKATRNFYVDGHVPKPH